MPKMTVAQSEEYVVGIHSTNSTLRCSAHRLSSQQPLSHNPKPPLSSAFFFLKQYDNARVRRYNARVEVIKSLELELGKASGEVLEDVIARYWSRPTHCLTARSG